MTSSRAPDRDPSNRRSLLPSGGAFIRYSSAWDAAAVRSLVSDITGGGLTPDHPVADPASVISADGPAAGAHGHTTDERIAEFATLTDRDELSFQFWFPNGRDLRCRVRRVHESLYATEFALDEYEYELQKKLAIAMATVRDDSAAVTAFVVDLPGHAFEVDWDAIVQGAPERITILPSLLGAPADIIDAHPEIGAVSRCDDAGLGELVVVGDLYQIGLSPNPTDIDELTNFARELERLRMTASSADNLIRVTTGALGDLRDVWLDPRVLDHRDADVLGHGVRQTAQEAAARAQAEAGALARPFTNRRADEPVDALFDPALAEIERMLALQPAPPRSDGRPVIGRSHLAPHRDRLLRRRDELRNTNVTALSPDGLITATVGGRGELIDLELDARVFERGSSKWLADAITSTAQAAIEARGT